MSVSGFKWSSRSLERLNGVDPSLRRVVDLALDISPVDFMVLEGVRTAERQKELYQAGKDNPDHRTTWTMDSYHLTGHAVDLAPVRNGEVDWEDYASFRAMGFAVLRAASILGVNVTWGAISPRGRLENPKRHASFSGAP